MNQKRPSNIFIKKIEKNAKIKSKKCKKIEIKNNSSLFNKNVISSKNKLNQKFF